MGFFRGHMALGKYMAFLETYTVYVSMCGQQVNNQCVECSSGSNGRLPSKKAKTTDHMNGSTSLSSHSTSSTSSSPTSGVTMEPAQPDQAPAVTYSIIYSPALGSDSGGGTDMDIEENDNGGKRKNETQQQQHHSSSNITNTNGNSNTVDLTVETDSALPHKTFTMPSGAAFFLPMSTSLAGGPAAAAATMLQMPTGIATPVRGSGSPVSNNSIYTDIFGVNKLFVSQTQIQPEVVSTLYCAH